MKKYYLYFEVLLGLIIILPIDFLLQIFFSTLRKIISVFMIMSATADWYSSRNLHIFQVKKAHALRNEEIEKFQKAAKKEGL